jgi:acetyl-CoA C-acetyltransferase
MSMSDIDLVEINEAFASVVMAWLKETGYPHGGPTSTAARLRSAIRWAPPARKLMTTLLHELERSGGRYGLQTMCEGGGQANVTIIERL